MSYFAAFLTLFSLNVVAQGRVYFPGPVATAPVTSSSTSYTLPPATTTTLGGVRIGSGLAVDNTGLMSATVNSNTAITQAGIQSAITSAAANTRVVIAPGTYTLTSNLLIQAKAGLILDGGGNVTLTGAISNFIILSGQLDNCRITGIRFVSTLNTPTTASDPAITTDQTITGSNLEIDHNYFTCPTADANGIGWVPVDGRAGQATNTNVFRTINIHHNTLENIGRCGVELLNQNNDYTRIYGLTIADNIIRYCGLNDTYGMGVSLSGNMQGVIIGRNVIHQSKLYSIEIINNRNVTVMGNYIESTIANCAGISINAQADNNNLSIANEHVTVTGNTVRTAYSPVQMTDVDYITITGNDLFNLNTSDASNGGVRLVRCRYGAFSANTVLSSSNNALTLNSSTLWQVTGNYLTNKLKTADNNAYEIVWLYGSATTNNRIEANTYEKNPAQTNVNGFVAEAGGAAGNIWSDSRAGVGFTGTNGTRYWIKTNGTDLILSPTP